MTQTEIRLSGRGVVGGMTAGPLYYLDKQRDTEGGKDGSTGEAALAAVTEAFRAAERGYLSLAAAADTGTPQRELMELYAMMAADPELGELTAASVRSGSTAGEAVTEAAEQLAHRMEMLPDALLASRAEDVRAVGMKVRSCLSGKSETDIAGITAPVILAADSMTPDRLAALPPERVLGLVLGQGGTASHTAILARAMGKPCVMGIGRLPDGMPENGTTVCVDGGSGTVILAPEEATERHFRQAADRQRETEKRLSAVRGLDDTAPDGRKIALYANVSSPDDVRAVLDGDAHGIGLYRSEFLFLGRNEAPGEEEQTEAYRRVLAGMKGMPVIIRTLDIGADKTVPYLQRDGEKEENPALGCRGVRLFLARRELAKTQLRALLRAADAGDLSVMFPMITGAGEFIRCMTLVSETAAELGGQTVRPRFGVMLETPAACLCVKELAQAGASFFSVGSNDLTQYTLAADREDPGAAPYYDWHHKGVLRLIRTAAEEAHRQNCKIGVCGEAAADPSMLPFFLSCGMDELSVPPHEVLAVRYALKHPGKN